MPAKIYAMNPYLFIPIFVAIRLDPIMDPPIAIMSANFSVFVRNIIQHDPSHDLEPHVSQSTGE